MGFKVYVTDVAQPDRSKWASNHMVFDTEVAATHYAMDLAMRWTALRDWEVREVSDTATYTFDADTRAVTFLETNVKHVPAIRVTLN